MDFLLSFGRLLPLFLLIHCIDFSYFPDVGGGGGVSTWSLFIYGKGAKQERARV
jgi:hypothetical protein